jgi:hypothetical protein
VTAEALDAYGVLVAGPPLLHMALMRYVSEVESLPAWPDDRQFRRDEWEQYSNLAREFQELPPYSVEQVFLAYTVLWTCEPGSDAASQEFNRSGVALSKAMILLRVMFDLPSPGWEATLDFGERLDFAPRANGGLPFNALPEEVNRAGSVSSPVAWRDGRPRLVALSRGAAGRPTYEANTEFRYFYAHFPYRGLDDG